MATEYNPTGSKTRFVLGLAEDIWKLGGSRQIAGEIATLTELLCQREPAKDRSTGAEPLFWVLPSTKSLLKHALESRPVAPSTITLRWGSSAPETTSMPEPAAEVTPPQTVRKATKAPVAAQSVPAPAFEAAAVATVNRPDPQLSPTVAGAAIDLADWVQKISEDQRISLAQAAQTARRKTDSLLAALKIERIERTGKFDDEDQEFVDSVATDDLALDLLIASTVESGYRVGNALIRPQRVLVYRYAPGEPASGPAPTGAVNGETGL